MQMQNIIRSLTPTITPVSGTVKYAAKDLKTFNHIIILTPDPEKMGNYYISYECFRFV
ncbi:hypothetical protein BKA69DRAFT_1054223 [Paraphysoderma sedebokerense]|nr:hypothetical protein BKA69DRAFT_1054223 [Paraphysoderma sedebokerense]